MSPVATYSFLPWLRQGIANSIVTADGDTAVTTRASVHVELLLSGDPVGGGDVPLTLPLTQDIALFGPGDIVGIDARAVVRTEPRHLVGNFESNFLPAVDFYDEDFPWRYTPAAPDASRLRLRPWITLVVLAEGEFEEGRAVSGRPLPFVTIANAGVFPPADELWAWAHVHFNESLSSGSDELVSPDMGAVLPRVQAILARNRDAAYSRLVSPRRLDENTDYHAFVVPTFESGRLAGLGLDPAGAPHATTSAWEPYPDRADPTSYPVYYRWFFRTGSRGDFEFLVRLLQPRPVDRRVGTRDMDVQDPAPNIPGILDPALGGVLRLGGALRVPDADLDEDDLAERRKYENWDQPYPHPFQRALAAFVNLADDYAEQSALDANTASGLADDDPDPLITSPLYGRWHALTQRLLAQRDGTPAPNDTNWVHRLGLDPGFRVPAAFGTEVVQANDEEYMDDAWQQIGDVLDANARIRRLHLATDVSLRWYVRHLTPLVAADPERAFAIAAPVAGRALVGGSTLAHRQTASLVPPVLTSTAFRRVLRPQARLMRALPFDATAEPRNLLARVNAAEVSAAPPKVVPPGVPTVDQAADAVEPRGVPRWVLELLSRVPWLPVAAVVVGIAILVVLLLAAPLVPALAVGLPVLAALGGVAFLLRRWQRAHERARSISEAGQTPEAVDRLPRSADFVLSEPGSNVRPTPGASDSRTAVRFKDALRDSFALLVASDAAAERPAPTTLDLPALAGSIVAAVDPAVTVPRRGFSAIAIPPFVAEQVDDPFGEVMAYPRIDLPMYEPLKAISVELFLPNIDLIAQNSITLIETNQKFIDAYMVGLNHEFARELLWREYPTDQRGSYFRQFWDVRSVINSEGLSENALREQLYDVPELHTWLPESNLGDHNHRAGPGAQPAQAVLAIRGELLKKYPTAVIYAHRADWARNADGSIDLSEPRKLVPLTPAEEEKPPREKVRSPLYEAKSDPDIFFFGFDLTITVVEGGSGEESTDDPGWFFVIKERPGEPRFGLELEQAPSLDVFDELAWDDALPGAAPGMFLPATSLASVPLQPLPPGDPEGKQRQRDDDEQVEAAPISSARWAYMLFRAPVMVAIHASEMLSTDS
ncbi:MAG: hypothetical protein ACRDGE_01455 [Candidatus Limnocylindria bacterium]